MLIKTGYPHHLHGCDFLCFTKLDELFVSLRSYVSNTEDRVSPHFQTQKNVENTTRSGVFLMNFEVFGNVVKQCLECLIYFLNRH